MSSDVNQKNKTIVWEFWRTLETADSDQLSPILDAALNPNVVCHGPAPIGKLSGARSFAHDFWLPLKKSFPDSRRDTYLFFGGRSSGRIDGTDDGRMWVTGTGQFTGTFSEDFLSIPATGRRATLRWGEFCRLEEGRIVEIFFLLDLIDLMQQAGFQVLPPSRGQDGVYPPPAAGDGILLAPQDESESAYSLEHIRKFIFEGLNAFDQSDLESMGMADYFHPDVKWYGPGGIGACLSFTEFETLHQRPWLHAFPDRSVQDLDALIAEGAYSGGPGWAGVKATHTGAYLGCNATGSPVDINGLDWWKRDGEMYVENWVFVDMIHLFDQLGVDLFARMREQAADRASRQRVT